MSPFLPCQILCPSPLLLLLVAVQYSYQGEELILLLRMEVQTGKSEKNAGQVGQGDVLGSAQQVLDQSDKVSTPSLPESPDFTQQQLPRTQFLTDVLETL